MLASVEMVEVLAMSQALWLAKELGFQSLIIKEIRKLLLMPSIVIIWPSLSLGISCKTLDYLFHLSFLFLFVMLEDKVIVWLID